MADLKEFEQKHGYPPTLTFDEDAFDDEPTEDEKETLRKVIDDIPKAAIFIVLTEFCERFTFYGLSGPFQNYIQFPPGNLERPGAIDGGQQMATALSNFFQFFCYLTPILGAIIADQFLGKFKTIGIFAFVYMMGLAVLTLTSIPAAIAVQASLPGLVIAMIIIGFGTGGIKSNVSPMVAEQYTKTKMFKKTLKNGEIVIVDPALTIQSIFNWFYWSINLGALSAIATTNLEHHVGFWSAYLLPSLMMLVGLVVFLLGNKHYRKSNPSGSILLKAFKAFKFAIRTKRISTQKYPHFLDYAKPSNLHDQSVEWNDKFIDELKRTLKACKVFLFYPLYWVAYGQISNNLISQAATMLTYGIPNDIMNNIDPLSLLILIPIFDRIIYPFLRRKNIAFGPIRRITLGFVTAGLAMAYSAVVQRIIYNTGPNYECTLCDENLTPNNVSVALQVPSYILIATSEIFASITGLEYAFMKAPASMKSIIMSAFLFTNCLGSIIAFGFVPIAVDPKLPWMYGGLAIGMLVIAFIFHFLFKHYDQQDEDENF